jgi:hypothetical protein
MLQLVNVACSQTPRHLGIAIPLRCYDNEDVEGWLIEEGIGHLDHRGNFQYGPDFEDMSAEVDIPSEFDGDD